MNAHVYILHSDALARYYTGISESPDVRLAQHVSGRRHWTSRADDWRRVFMKEVPTMQQARDLEKRIKAQGAKRFIQRQQ